ncbi:MAG: hypothetical protein WCF85_10370 [Rhodospirillaceae bacterium]
MASPVTPVAASGNATILTYLSLFLLLLVFFIVLNAHSTQRDYRVQAVLGSVERSFPATGTMPGQGSPAAVAFAGFRKLGELFETELSIVKVDPVGRGRLMVVSMPADELFADGSNRIRREHFGLLDRISRQIGDHGPVRFEVEFMVAVGNEPAGELPFNDPVVRAAAVAGALIGDRAPADAVSVGIEPGRSGTVRFLFSARFTGGSGGGAGGGRAMP